MPNKLLQTSKAWAGWVLMVLLAVSVVLSIINSEAIHAVTVQVIDVKTEVRDPSLPGLAQVHTLPDYRIEVMRPHDSRVNLGTIVDTSASEPLRWTIQEPIPLRTVSSLRLVEDDKIANDVIEEVQIEGESFSSGKYRYGLTIGRTASAAQDYFFRTPIGLVILGAIGLAIFLWLASHMSWF